MKRVWFLALALLPGLALGKPRPSLTLLRSDRTLQSLGWRSEWEWQGARAALEHLGLKVVVVNESELAARPSFTTSVVVLSNARNLEASTLAAVRQHLTLGGKLLASYQTSYRQADNTPWTPNDLALGPELGVHFLRWNGTAGETESLKVGAPYGTIPLARHQAMLVEPSPDAYVLAQWDKPEEAASVVQKEGAIYLGEDLLAPENSHSRQVLGFMAGLLNRLDPRFHLSLPKTGSPLLEPNPPFTPLPEQKGEGTVRVGLGKLVPRDGALTLRGVARSVRIESDDKQLWMVIGRKRTPLGLEWSISTPRYLNCWQELPAGPVRWGAYRGKLRLKWTAEGIEAVNELPADSYLAGVIPSEVPFTYPAEALKAMAVVARTYASSHLGRHSGEGFDVCSEVHCQVYRGLAQENPSTTQAVLATRGEMLYFQDRAADTTFHACCGGHGVDVQATWPKSGPIAYLEGSYDQLPSSPIADLSQEDRFRQWLDARHPAYCSGAGRFRWEEQMAWTALETKLKQSLAIDTLKGISVTRRDRSGRVAELTVQAEPKDVVVEGDAVRWITSGGKIGAGGLQSSLFYLDISGDGPARQVRIRGGGWGHGVGLCQEGAAGRARAGQNYRQLLAHYYPGTQLRREPPAPR